jgi:5'-methylthioadenosine phosphorylase
MLAIIGGSGLTQLANLDVTRREVVRTPYGEPSGALVFGSICGQPVVFLARHGYGHTLAPHEINYRANIWALHAKGVSGIIAVAAVGSIRPDLKPGELVIPHQIIDYTWGRRSTYFEEDGKPVTHIDFTDPFDEGLRQKILSSATAAKVKVAAGAVYACTQGPRLETAAEIVRIERDGGDVVGMTGMPEAVLAREIGLPYAAINVVANYAAGRADSQHGISFDGMQVILDQSMGQVRNILEHLTKCGHA